MGFLSKVAKTFKRAVKDVGHVAEKVGKFQLDIADPLGLVHKQDNALLRAVADPVGAVLETQSPKLAKIRRDVGMAGATAIVGGLALGAAGSALGLTDIASSSALQGGAGGLSPAPGNDMGWLDTINKVLDTAGNIAKTGQGVVDQFGGRSDQPNAVASQQAPLMGQTIPTWAIVGGAAAVVVLVVVLVRK